MSTPARERVLGEVRARLAAFSAEQDAAIVLDDEALAMAGRLSDPASDPAADLDAAHAAGWLHWYRFVAAGGDSDLDTAVRLLAPVYLARPEAVPDQLSDFFARNPTGGWHQQEARAARGADLLQRALERDDQSALDGAIDLLRQAVAATPGSDPDLSSRLTNLGVALRARFERDGRRPDLDDAIAYSRRAVDVSAPAEPSRALLLVNLGIALHAGGSTAELADAIAAWQAALAVTPAEDLSRPGILSNIALAHRARFERTGSRHDLDQAVATGREAVAAASADHPERARLLYHVGMALEARHERSRAAHDLQELVGTLREAVAATPESQPDLPGYLSKLAAAVALRFDRTGSMGDLDETIAVLRRAVSLTPDGDPHRAGRLAMLAVAMSRRSERTQARADLDQSVEIARAAVRSTGRGHPELAGRLSVLGGALHARLAIAGTTHDADELVAVAREAVARTPANDGALETRLSHLVSALHARAERTAGAADLDEAIDVGRRALAARRSHGPERATVLSNLGIALRKRFEQSAGACDLDESVESLQRALVAVPADHAGRPTILSNLGIALQDRFQYAGEPADLQRALDVLRAAVADAGAGDPHRAGYLTNLGNALRASFDGTGAHSEADEAVETLRQAVAETPLDHAELGPRLSNLGLALQSRFEQFGATVDLDEAAETLRLALAVTPTAHPLLARRQTNLAAALHRRFARKGRLADVEEAIDLSRRAVNAAAPGDPELPGALQNLGISLRSRFDRTHARADVDEAVDAARQALEATPVPYARESGGLSNLAVALKTRFDHIGDARDLDEAIELSRGAIAAAPADSPSRAAYCLALASALRSRSTVGGGAADVEEAIESCRQAIDLSSAPPALQAESARLGGALLADRADWQGAVDAYAAAVGLMAQVASRALDRSDQEHRLSVVAGLGAQAAACCLQINQAERALELWEQGRAVLLGRALDARTDVTDLAERRPELADRFRALRDQLDTLSDLTAEPLVRDEPPRAVPREPGTAMRLQTDRRRTLAREFEVVVEEARRIAGLERFLLAPRAADLFGAATEGPLVVTNISSIRSDALILGPDGVDIVPLPELTPQRLVHQVLEFETAVTNAQDPAAGPDGRSSGERGLADVLAWLWDTLAGPVLERLSIVGAPSGDDPWPRVWWCPSGLLSFLPLHAAGYHSTRFDAVPETVMDRAMSSYTPTVRALAHSRRRPPEAESGDPKRVLVVAMPHTAEASDLPGAMREAELLAGLFGTRTVLLEGPSATREAVCAALPTVPWAHFACHATSSLDDPSAGRLLLHDHHSRPLTVVDVARLRLENVQIAFLSACSTARTGVALADEAIHLASAFQLAGYRHVIATLWPIGDRPAVRTATEIYTELSADAGAERAAAALHHSTRRLRSVLPEQPSVWATYIHSGA